MQATLINLSLVGLGGFIGAILRYILHDLTHRHGPDWTFPLGTLLVNILGCLGIGVFAALADARGLWDSEVRSFGAIGVLGGFTTFSAFGFETFSLLRDGESARAFANVTLQLLLGVGAVWIGYALASGR